MSASTHSSTISSSARQAGLPLLLIIALLVAFFAAWPLISEPGFLNTRGGGDSPFLLQRVQQLELAIRDGHFPVRWMRDANYGFGYPFFNYYAPLSIYIAAFFRLFGFSTIRSIEATQLSGFLVAGMGAFFLARRWYCSEWAAFLTSVAYTTAPFHLVNVYVRGDSLAEFWAMALYPWIFLTADRLLAGDYEAFPFGRVAAFAFAYAALILSHNISALIFTPFLILFIVLRWLLRSPAQHDLPKALFSIQHGRLLLSVLAGGLLALALAAWFFWPALTEQQFAQLDPVTTGYFHFTNHFRDVDLVQSSAIFDYEVSGGNAFRMGFIQAAGALLGSVVLLYVGFRQQSVAKAPVLFILLTLGISTFMITPLSRVLWENLPLLPFTQFPWRFLSIQAFAAALTIGALALLPYCRLVTIVTAVILIASSFAGLRTDHLLLNDDDITAASLAEYEWFTGNIGSTVSAEYLLPSVQPRFFNSSWLNTGDRAAARALDGELLRAKQQEHQSARQRWTVQTGGEGATVVFPTMAWPGWRATMDGQLLQLQPAPGSGHIMVQLPPGEHELILELTRTAVRRGAELLSLAALLIALFFLFKSRPSALVNKPAVVIVLSLILFLILFRFWPQENLSAGTLTWDFAQMAYLHHDEQGVPFSSGTRLLNYEYSREAVAAGQDVTINLDFSYANDDVATVSLGSAALTWPAFSPEPPSIATQTATVADEQIALDLKIPANAPPGLYIPRLTLNAGRPLMPSGRLRGDLFLRPLHITNDQTVVVGDSLLDVKIIDVERRDRETVDVQLAWSVHEQLSHNYIASILLLDEAGNWLAQLDTQPGYGFLPSSEWTPGKQINDWLALGLPDNPPQATPLALVARLYEADSAEVVLTRRLGELIFEGTSMTFAENQPRFSIDSPYASLAAQFDGQVQLLGYELQHVTGATWQLTLHWRALGTAAEDAVRFVHVFDPRTEEIVFQIDGHPRGNSYPLSQWTEGEIVTDTLILQLNNAPAGEYAVGIGFYREADGTVQRLSAVDPITNESFAHDRILLPQTVEYFTHR